MFEASEDILTAPPSRTDEFPTIVAFVITGSPFPKNKPPALFDAELLATTILLNIELDWLNIPPPSAALLFVIKVLFNVVLLLMKIPHHNQ